MMERGHLEVGLVPVADFLAGTKSTDVINMKDHNRIRFILYWGVGITGTSTITVEACDNVTPSTTSAIAFKYRETLTVSDPGAITSATSAGFLTTAGSNRIVEVEVTAADLNASGYGYVRLTAVEVTASPRLGGCLIELLEPRHAGATQLSAVT